MLHRDSRELKDKQLLAWDREMERLRQAVWNAPIVPLEKPYQKGWTKRFALRDDITRRRDADTLTRLLKIFNTTLYCKRADFLVMENDKLVPMVHELKIIPKKEFEAKNLPAECFGKVSLGYWHRPRDYSSRGGGMRFRSENTFDYNPRGYNLTPIHGYQFAIPSYFLIDDIQPNIITHQQVVLPEIESRLAELTNKFNRDNLWCRLNKIVHGSEHGGYRDYWRRDPEEILALHLDPDEY